MSGALVGTGNQFPDVSPFSATKFGSIVGDITAGFKQIFTTVKGTAAVPSGSPTPPSQRVQTSFPASSRLLLWAGLILLAVGIVLWLSKKAKKG